MDYPVIYPYGFSICFLVPCSMCLSIASDGFNTGYVMRYGDSTAEEIIGVIAVHAAGGCDLDLEALEASNVKMPSI